jgi:hypothetical protein
MGKNSFLVVGLTCAVFLFFPLIWNDEASTKQHLRSLGDSTLGFTVHKSLMLPAAHIGLIASTLPLIFDIFCDAAVVTLSKSKRQSSIGGLVSIEFRTRLLFMMLNIVPSSVYLHMRFRGGTLILPLYYAAVNQLTIVVILSCSLFVLNSRRIVPSIVLLLEQSSFSVVCVLKIFNLLFPRRERLMSIATALAVVGYVCFAMHMVCWLVSIRRRFLESTFKMDKDEEVLFIFL